MTRYTIVGVMPPGFNFPSRSSFWIPLIPATNERMRNCQQCVYGVGRLQEGVTVRAGDHLGIMKFGSRMDVFVPADAVIAVKIGDKVRGGETVIAVLHSSK
jgi:phosphatidylserine decarboxylase